MSERSTITYGADTDCFRGLKETNAFDAIIMVLGWKDSSALWCLRIHITLKKQMVHAKKLFKAVKPKGHILFVNFETGCHSNVGQMGIGLRNEDLSWLVFDGWINDENIPYTQVKGKCKTDRWYKGLEMRWMESVLMRMAIKEWAEVKEWQSVGFGLVIFGYLFKIINRSPARILKFGRHEAKHFGSSASSQPPHQKPNPSVSRPYRLIVQ